MRFHDIPWYSMILQYTQRPSKADLDYMIFHAIPRYSTISHYIQQQGRAYFAIWPAVRLRPALAEAGSPGCGVMMCESTLFHDNPRYPILFNSNGCLNCTKPTPHRQSRRPLEVNNILRSRTTLARKPRGSKAGLRGSKVAPGATKGQCKSLSGLQDLLRDPGK